MARFSPYSARSRRRRRTHSIYLAIAVAVFAVLVYFLFWGDSSNPQGAVAGEENVAAVGGESAPAETRAPMPEQTTPVEPTPTRPATSERSNLALPQVAQPNASAPVAQPDSAPPAQTMPAVSPAVTAQEAKRDPQAEQAIGEAMALLKGPRRVIAARDKLNETLAMDLSPEQRRRVKAEMAKLSEEWLFGPSVFAGDSLCETYKVQRGDLLQVIGRRNKVPYEILMQINNIPRPESLQAGAAIKVIKGPFHAKVCRSTFTLELYLQDTYVRSFKVGLGKPGHETPTGWWRVAEGGRLIQPPWYDEETGRTYQASDPDYPLGSRWIALDGISGNAKGRTGFAIHGTKDPDQIGMAGSRGCIRMYNGECVLMFNLLFPLYSRIEVVE